MGTETKIAQCPNCGCDGTIEGRASKQLRAQLTAAREACEAALVALELLMRWVGPPPVDPYSFDSLREDGWKTATQVAAQLRAVVKE